LVLYLLHGPGQLLDRFPVSPPPCSRPGGEGTLTLQASANILLSFIYMHVYPSPN